MKKKINIVTTEVMKYNPQHSRFECNKSDLSWGSVPATFLLFNPESRGQETLILKSTSYVDSCIESWRYESSKYLAVINNI